MSIVFTSFKHYKLPIGTKIPVTTDLPNALKRDSIYNIDLLF